MRSKKVLVLVVAVAGAALAACGDSVDEAGSGGAGAAAGAGGEAGTGGAAGGGGATGGGGTSLDCRTDADCEDVEPQWADMCVPPGGSGLCGMCTDGMDPCDTDAECKAQLGDEYVCGPPENETCSCGNYAGNCTLACTGPVGCEATEECTTEGHCIPKVCAVDGDCQDAAQRCPPTLLECVVAECAVDGDCEGNFRCNALYQCERRTCTGDAQCVDYCVTGRCFESLGRCEGPVA